MSYLSSPASKTEYGLVTIGDYIDVDANGVISVPEIVGGTGVVVTYSNSAITISSSGADIISTHGTTSNYTATANDEYIGVNSTSATIITLPTGANGRVYTIKDEHGAGMGKITVQPQTGQLIDGKVNYVIGAAYQGITTVFRSNGWWII